MGYVVDGVDSLPVFDQQIGRARGRRRRRLATPRTTRRSPAGGEEEAEQKQLQLQLQPESRRRPASRQRRVPGPCKTECDQTSAERKLSDKNRRLPAELHRRERELVHRKAQPEGWRCPKCKQHQNAILCISETDSEEGKSEVVGTSVLQ